MEIISSISLSLLSSDYDYDVYNETQYRKGLAHSRHIHFLMFFLPLVPPPYKQTTLKVTVLKKYFPCILSLHYFMSEKSRFTKHLGSDTKAHITDRCVKWCF